MAAKMAGSISGFLCLDATRREDAPASEQGAIYGDTSLQQIRKPRLSASTIDRSIDERRATSDER